MKHLDFGLKLWSTNTDLIRAAIQLIDEKIFNYIELLVVPGTQIDPFIIDVPYIVHIPHHKFGVNIGEAVKKEYNLQKINESMEWADKLKARYLILHAGHGCFDDAEDLLEELVDTRLLIENMPKLGLDNEEMIGYSQAQTKELMGNNRGLCLDFGHAVKASISLGKNYKEYIKGFLALQPQVFHISDGMFNIEKDEHLNIGEGEYDFEYFMNCVKKNKNKYITLETPRRSGSLDEDIANLRKLLIF